MYVYERGLCCAVAILTGHPGDQVQMMLSPGAALHRQWRERERKRQSAFGSELTRRQPVSLRLQGFCCTEWTQTCELPGGQALDLMLRDELTSNEPKHSVRSHRSSSR